MAQGTIFRGAIGIGGNCPEGMVLGAISWGVSVRGAIVQGGIVLEPGTLLRSESNDDDGIIANTHRQLKDIIALHGTNTITKYNLVKETKGFSKDVRKLFCFIKKDVCRTENISIIDFKMFYILVRCAAPGTLNLHPL